MIKALFISILSFIPIYFWIQYSLKRDEKKEPFYVLAIAFFVGMLSTIPAFFLEKVLIKDISPPEFLDYTRFDLYIIITLIFAAIEELFKFLFLRFSVFEFREFDEPIDGFVYGAIGALGFAFVENLMIGISVSTFEAIPITTIRGLSANILHFVTTGIIGYGFVNGLILNNKFYFYFSIIVATLLHTIFNLMIMEINLYLFVIILIASALTILNLQIKILKEKIIKT